MSTVWQNTAAKTKVTENAVPYHDVLHSVELLFQLPVQLSVSLLCQPHLGFAVHIEDIVHGRDVLRPLHSLQQLALRTFVMPLEPWSQETRCIIAI